MKTLLFVCGPNGIGKTTICRQMVDLLPRSAYVDTDPCRVMNPFVLSEETIPTIAKNISDLLINYLNCPAVDTVLLSYGFHGERKAVFRRVIEALAGTPHRFLPFLLWCSEEENRRRMLADGRAPQRTQRALTHSRGCYGGVPYPKIVITDLSARQAAEEILARAGLRAQKACTGNAG